jgi:hypothetical protein
MHPLRCIRSWLRHVEWISEGRFGIPKVVDRSCELGKYKEVIWACDSALPDIVSSKDSFSELRLKGFVKVVSTMFAMVVDPESLDTTFHEPMTKLQAFIAEWNLAFSEKSASELDIIEIVGMKGTFPTESNVRTVGESLLRVSAVGHVFYKSIAGSKSNTVGSHLKRCLVNGCGVP